MALPGRGCSRIFLLLIRYYGLGPGSLLSRAHHFKNKHINYHSIAMKLLNTLIGILLTITSVIIASPLPASNQELPRDLTPRGVPAWQFYYGADSSTHQTNFNKWSAAGYRLISLSAYGQPPNVRYAA